MKLKKTAALLSVLAMLANVSSASVPFSRSTVNAISADGVKYEFEDAVFDGCKPQDWTKIDECASGNSADISDWSGKGFGYLDQKGSSITVEVEVEKEGLYELIFRYVQCFDLTKKVQYLNVNGSNQGEVSFPYCEEFTEMSAGYVPLKKGKNQIQIKAYWGYTLFDYMIVKEADPSIAKLSPMRELSNPNASETTKRLYSYLCDMYGEHIISGQQEYCGSHNYNINAFPDSGYIIDNEAEFQYIEEKTGEMPAIRGIDFLSYSSSSTWDDNAAERAAEWFNKFHGLVTLTYHWNVPSSPDDLTNRAFYVESASATYTTFSVSKALEEGTWENEVLMADIDFLAKKLQILKDADVPVLWRPLHEAEGAWFWWGAEGPENCKKLYHLLYDQLTNVYGLDNLIWVWTSSTFPTSPQWYPGDECVDILGYDKYNAVDGLPNLSAITSTFYNLVASADGKKLVAMTENDSIPSLENLLNEKASWLWFCPWYMNYLTSEQNNPVDNLIEIYQSDYCITLDELPDIRSYPINGVSSGSTPSVTTKPAVTTTGSKVTSKPTVSTSAPQITSKPVVTTSVSQTTSKPDVTTSPNVTSAPSKGQDDTIIYGDVNGDTIPDLSDLTMMSQAMLKDIEFTEKQRKAADVNGDNEFAINDLSVMKQYVMNDDVKLGPIT